MASFYFVLISHLLRKFDSPYLAVIVSVVKTILHRDLINITAANTLMHFGGALIEVFVPLLLITHGLSLLGVSVFYLVYAAVKLAVNYQAMRLTNRFGARLSLIFARMVYILYLLCLVAIVNGHPLWIAWIMAAALAFTNAFQWNAQHAHISRVINMERKGKDIARIDSIDMIAASVAPAVSAVLALLLNQDWPLYVAVASIVVSIYWLRGIDSEAGGHVAESTLRYNLSHAPKRDLLANFAFNFHTAIGGLVWPMYLAFVLGTVGSIGLVTTIGALGTAIFLLFVGNRNDNVGTSKVLAEGSIATFVAHLMRLLPGTAVVIGAVNIIWMIALRYQLNPWTSTYYAHTREKGFNYILSMEIACDVAYVALFITVFILLSLLGYQAGFYVLFVLAALMSLVCTKITPAKD